ncbi:MAG: type II secretion system major pseudopilin GspG [bacterium]
MRKFYVRSNQKGFTLIELMVVVAILGLLATIAGSKIMDALEQSKWKAAGLQISSFESPLKQYKIDNGVYPTTEQGLDALMKKTEVGDIPQHWRQYMDRIPKDPWKRDYIYISPGEHNDEYDLESYGKDGEDGGEGWAADIESWNLGEGD